MQFYSASFTGDLRQVVDHVLGRFPQSNVYAVGWSLGANILVRYLGEVSSLLIDDEPTVLHNSIFFPCAIFIRVYFILKSYDLCTTFCS